MSPELSVVESDSPHKYRVRETGVRQITRH